MSEKLYIETSIVSYLAARPSRDLIVAAHQKLTHDWWDLERADFELYASELVWQEAAAGDSKVAARRLELLQHCEQLWLTEPCRRLADEFVDRHAVPAKAIEDAFHIAVAAINHMNYLLTWNCKHIANARIQKKLAEICEEAGHQLPVICTPDELLGE